MARWGPLSKVWVCEELKTFIYLIPKCANNSIRHITNKKFHWSAKNKKPFPPNHSLSLIENPEYTKIVMLRQPFDRFVSGYIWYWICLTPKHRPPILSISEDEFTFEFTKEFTEVIEKRGVDTYVNTEYYLSQYYYLTRTHRRDTVVPLTHVFTLENIDRDFPKFKELTQSVYDKFVKHNYSLAKQRNETLYKYLETRPDLTERINTMLANDWKVYKQYC